MQASVCCPRRCTCRCSMGAARRANLYTCMLCMHGCSNCIVSMSHPHERGKCSRVAYRKDWIVGAPHDQSLAVAEAAATHCLVQGLRDPTLVIK